MPDPVPTFLKIFHIILRKRCVTTKWHLLFGAPRDFVLASLSNCHPSYPQQQKKLLFDYGVLSLDVPQDSRFTYLDQFSICFIFYFV